MNNKIIKTIAEVEKKLTIEINQNFINSEDTKKHLLWEIDNRVSNLYKYDKIIDDIYNSFTNFKKSNLITESNILNKIKFSEFDILSLFLTKHLLMSFYSKIAKGRDYGLNTEQDFK
jgi:hypothetical protein